MREGEGGGGSVVLTENIGTPAIETYPSGLGCRSPMHIYVHSNFKSPYIIQYVAIYSCTDRHIMAHTRSLSSRLCGSSHAAVQRHL